MINVKHVLLIDDDPIANFINARLIKTTCRTEEISQIKNGNEALTFLTTLYQQQAPCPDLIFLDINMPVMDGFEFLGEFKKLKFINHDTLKVVILSTSSYYADVEKFLLYGIQDFIIKPLTPAKLNSILQKLW